MLKPQYTRYSRNKLKSRLFPESWNSILSKNMPYLQIMPEALQVQLKQHILVFLDEKAFYGFEGIEITDEIKVTVAAQACLLLLNRETDYYPALKSIYIYPAAFVAQHASPGAAGVLNNQRRVLSGESWGLGKVVLSWHDTKVGADLIDDGHNVVIHEFAHQLDQETGSANGAPFLKSKKNSGWATVLKEEFEHLQEATRAGDHSLLDSYGATNPAEFFAVATEVFFERPVELSSLHPRLYNQLQAYYQVNPACW